MDESKVLDSRLCAQGKRRRRECAGCGMRYTTYERVEPGDNAAEVSAIAAVRAAHDVMGILLKRL